MIGFTGGDGAAAREAAKIAEAREELARRFRRLYEQGAVTLFEGNMSVRVGDTVLITPSQQDKEALTSRMMTALALDGSVLAPGVDADGGTVEPSTEYRMHLALYRLRPDARAVVHTHSACATAFALAGAPIAGEMPELFSQFGGEVECLAYGRPGTEDVCAGFAACFGERRRDAALLANHGLVCIGSDLTEAFARAETAEKLAKTILLARLLGSQAPLPAGEADALRDAWEAKAR